MKISIFWDIKSCSSLKVCSAVLATCIILVSCLLLIRPWRWRHIPLKCWLTLNGQHGVIFQKILFFELNPIASYSYVTGQTNSLLLSDMKVVHRQGNTDAPPFASHSDSLNPAHQLWPYLFKIHSHIYYPLSDASVWEIYNICLFLWSESAQNSEMRKWFYNYE
jgi:hypothetical protein